MKLKGPLSGVEYDENTENIISVPEYTAFAEALFKARGEKTDILGFDVCLLGNLEVALNLAPYADYMIASAESEPTLGWFYEWMSVFGEAYEERGNLLTAAEPECHLADCDKIPEWGRNAAHWAVANGIIYGNNGSILPDDYVKTTEAVAMISRLGKSTEE